MLVNPALVVALIAAPPVVERFELSNGVRAVVVHVPDAPKQTTFTFLPLSLATDGPNEAQWSHLVEHLLIRSTDPHALQADGMEFNGETGPECLRLDSYAAPEQWRASIERHAKWLAARSFDADTLEREKVMIAGEERGTSTSGFTHKWAIAAWNQIIRHGLDHAAVHGDVAGASVESVMGAARARLPIDQSVLIATIGPAEPDAVRAAMQEMLGGLPVGMPDASRKKAAAPRLEGDVTATWDLPTRHVLIWWRLPDASPATRAAATALFMDAQMRLQTLKVGGEKPGVVLIHPVVNTPEGSCFIVNLRLAPGIDPAAARNEVVQAMNSGNPEMALRLGRMNAMNWGPAPDFAASRRNLQGRMRDLLEGQWLLTRSMEEFNWGMPAEAIAGSLRELTAESIRPVAERLRGAPTGSLVLEPRD
ncbi:MAG: insulinase family protein [Phycisphaeraceae bacterium]|nr:hypothetical protein [Phycisphaerales bacterium]QOJ16900.1 MAG: insulinase family protein [Phycisphaeraceae bacterium]